MAKIVNVEVQTVVQSFPLGTVDTPFVYVVTKDGATVDSKSVEDTLVQFVWEAGNYVVTVTKNDVSASASFTIAPEDVKLNVPTTVTVFFV